MTTRSRRRAAIYRGSEIPTPTPIGRPAATGTVELKTVRAQTGRLALPEPYTAVEMTRAWKSQNDSHTRLEISHRTRDSHIPTAKHPLSQKGEDEDRRPLERPKINWPQEHRVLGHIQDRQE